MDRYQELSNLGRKWTPPSELIAPGERDVRLARSGVALAVVAVALVFGGVGVGIGLQLQSKRDADLQKQLDEQGRDADAIVTRHWRRSSKDHQPMVDYEFETGGQTYHRSVSAPHGIWSELRVGSPLPVRFLPFDPMRSHPRDWPIGEIPWWTIPLVMVSMSIGPVIIAVVVKRQLTLLREGRPAPGIVTRHSYGGNRQRKVYYDFVLPDGATVSGKTVRQMRDVPSVGATICVLYHPENPQRNALYPMEMARVAGPNGR